MPRIAVLSDIHGNVPALDAVLEDLADQRPDEVLVGGDLVGRGPQGSAIVRRIRQLGWTAIRGNHEDYLLSFRRRDVPERWLHDPEWSASRWMAAELDPDDVGFIDALPFSTTSRLAPGLRLVHGTPRSNREGIGPWSSESRLGEHLAEIDEPLLVCAHTHRPLHRRLGGGTVVNVGSVGLPFNRDHRAQYAIFERRDGADESWGVELRQVPYDLDAIRRIYRATGFLEQGGITARLLAIELEHAAPVLVPFMAWAEAHEVAPTPAALDRFFENFEPGRPLGPFFDRLAALRSKL
jgi:predicted phosphodiesterase